MAASSSPSTPAPPASARWRSTPTARPSPRLPRVPAALPPTRVGRARRRRHLARRPGHAGRRGRRARRRTPSPGSASPTSARRSWCGTVRPGDPATGPIVWQDRRTAARCDELRAAGLEPLVRERTGLVLDPYFSATKLEWLLARGRRRAPTPTSRSAPSTRGSSGTSPASTPRSRRTRAARCSTTSTPATGPPSCSTCSASRGRASRGAARAAGASGSPIPRAPPGLAVPVSGIAGDQQAALFGQACFTPGMTKNTYGTGSFVLVNLGDRTRRRSTACSRPSRGSSATPSRTRWRARSSSPAPRCSGCATVSASSTRRPTPDRWPRASTTPTASSSSPRSPGSARPGSTRTPAARSSGSPAARPARTSCGRWSRRWRGRPPTSSTRSPPPPTSPITELRVDGGASAMDVLCQFQADVLDVTVRRPVATETTALGAAYLAGIAEGVWASPGRRRRRVARRRRVPPRAPPPRRRTPRRVAPRRRPHPRLGRPARIDPDRHEVGSLVPERRGQVSRAW